MENNTDNTEVTEITAEERRFHAEVENPELVYRRYFDRVYRYCRRRLPIQADAEDVCAQVFAEALVALPRLRWQKKPVLAFLYTLAHRRLANHWKKNRRYESVHIDEVELSSTVPSIDSLVEYSRLIPAIDGLPIDQRTGVYLQVIHGLSFAEVGKIMGRREKACKSLVYRGLANVRKTLENEGVGTEQTTEELVAV